MATLANIFSHFVGAGSIAAAAPDTIRRESSDYYRLRALPNEDVYFFVKRIDNSRVEREIDPLAHARSWRLVGVICTLTVLLILLLMPTVVGLMAGYQLNDLQEKQQRLLTERASLELEEARLVSAKRLQELADSQQFIVPAPERVIYLQPGNDGTLALNRN
ncbi:MAG: hypothetical protein ACRD7E_33190 [Bryobacteraceae bacterium]